MKKNISSQTNKKLTLNAETLKIISGGGVSGTTRGTFPTVGNTTPNTGGGNGSVNCPESSICPSDAICG